MISLRVVMLGLFLLAGGAAFQPGGAPSALVVPARWGTRAAVVRSAILEVSGGEVVTPSLRSYSEEKFAKSLDRYDSFLTSVALRLRVEPRGGGLHDSKHHGKVGQVAEATAVCKNRMVIKLSSESENMYASVDELSDMLSRKLRKHKERTYEEYHPKTAPTLASDELAEEDDDFTS